VTIGATGLNKKVAVREIEVLLRYWRSEGHIAELRSFRLLSAQVNGFISTCALQSSSQRGGVSLNHRDNRKVLNALEIDVKQVARDLTCLTADGDRQKGIPLFNEHSGNS
jgi:hypothetical protein